MRITHLSLPSETRRLAAIRAAQTRRTLSQYVGALIDQDASAAGLRAYLASHRADRQGTDDRENVPDKEHLTELPFPGTAEWLDDLQKEELSAAENGDNRDGANDDSLEDSQ